MSSQRNIFLGVNSNLSADLVQQRGMAQSLTLFFCQILASVSSTNALLGSTATKAATADIPSAAYCNAANAIVSSTTHPSQTSFS